MHAINSKKCFGSVRGGWYFPARFFGYRHQRIPTEDPEYFATPKAAKSMAVTVKWRRWSRQPAEFTIHELILFRRPSAMKASVLMGEGRQSARG
jgi:hypothetical protein